jgi:SAM-dependent methyltransferase
VNFTLRQRGRALMDFEVAVRLAAGRLQMRAERELADKGISTETLPDDMEERHRVIDKALAGSPVFEARALLGEWTAKQHGLAAVQAFDEVRGDIVPEIERLREGATTLTRHDFAAPDYWSKIWFHRTHGGWDGGDYNGFVHGEIVHRKYVSKVFPGDVYANRRTVLHSLPRADYRRILEIGTSSGHHTLAIAEVFPDAKLTGVDPSLRMLEQAQRVGNEKGFDWNLHTAIGEDMPMFADNSFDLATAYAIHHEMPVKSIQAIFAEAFRVLEPGGDMIMADIARTDTLDRMTAWRFDWLARWGGEPFWRSTARLDMVPMAQAAGFVDVRGWHPRAGADPYIIYGRKPAADAAKEDGQ